MALQTAGRGRSAGGFPGSPMVNDPRTGEAISQAELTARNAQEQLGRDTASARGEIYPDNPYGVGGGGSGAPGGAYGSAGSYGAGGGFAGAGSPAGNNVVTSPGAGGGNINLSRGAYEDQQAMQLRANLADRAFARVSGEGGGTPSARVNYGDGGAADAARASAFARAKEQAGQNAAAAMRTLEEVAGRRGIRGSSIESGMIGDIVSGGRGEVNDFTREQLIQDLNNIQHTADVSYQGGIQQRGQDMNARQAMLSILAGLY